MRAAWLEDILSLLPPIAFLVSMRYRNRPPNREYPYGHQRATVIAFLCSAVVLSMLGLYLVVDSAIKLFTVEYTTIGSVELFDHTVWQGWLMIVALAYSGIPPVIIGHYQEKWARNVHEKTVHVDAQMSKADWATAVAGIVGIIGLGWGIWWLDAFAALVIGLDVSRDGLKNLKEAVEDLLDRRPRSITTGQPTGLEEQLEAKLEQLEWVKQAGVRLREQGHVLCGEAFVVPHSDTELTQRLSEAVQLISEEDWRLSEVVVTSVPHIKAHTAASSTSKHNS